MSIPKEPRQLMINLMYLVLTAMLALNVSAQIINAFFMINNGIQASNTIVDKSNTNITEALKKQTEAYSKFQPLADRADKARQISKDFSAYIETVRDKLIDAGGNNDGKADDSDYMDGGKLVHGIKKPLGYKNKDITTRLLVKEELGRELRAKIESTAAEFIKLLDGINIPGVTIKKEEIEALKASIALKIDEEAAKEDGKTWEYYTFNQMPLAAVYPILTKYQNDAKSAETALLNFLAGKAGAEEIKFDKFFPVLAAKKSYVISGEPFEADVFLSAYSSTASNIRLSVNGAGVALKDGIGQYKTGTSATGTQKVNVTASVTNPVTNVTETFSKSFEYEVGRRSASVSADKMNVFYIGVDNPISVSAAGVSSNELRVNMTGGTLTPAQGQNKYTVRVSSPGTATVTLSGGGLQASNYEFRVKRIPDPVAKLGGKHIEGALGNGEFKAQRGVFGVLENFDFEAKCDVVGFEVTRVPKRQDPVTAQNPGPNFSGNASSLVALATPGDIYYFDNVKARCPGDGAARLINGLVFKIR